METSEHKNAGNLIRIAPNENPYLEGGTDLSPESKDPLNITMMRKVNGVPVPLDLTLSAGDVVCLAGDYYTKAGWGSRLRVSRDRKKTLDAPVTVDEAQAFRQAYDDLASPAVTQKAIKRIYAIDESRYIPSLLKQLLFTFTVKDYGEKLSENEAHFAPWSLRAYIVGHHSALRMAQLAYYCHQKAGEGIGIADILKDENAPQQLRKALQAIQKDPAQYDFKRGHDDNTILEELGRRYHAMAIARDLFAMHFYSDHFAGGHLSRIGPMRRILPEKFGVWGSILVNNMHNEDNEDSVTVTNPFQPERDAPFSQEDKPFQMIREDNQAFGDGTYFERQNAENSNMLINGMDNSLGDIARLMETGEKRTSDAYGGLTFLPEIDYSKRQTQPLLIMGEDNHIYFRSDVKHIKVLSPSEYQDTIKNPTKHGYQKLTYWKSFLLVLQLRLSWSSPKVDPLSKEEERNIAQDEQRYADQISKKTPAHSRDLRVSAPTIEEGKSPEIGAWRKHSKTDVSVVPLSLLAARQKAILPDIDELLTKNRVINCN
ncbi:hypothetical protein [Legionella spiritensis]|uniref:hypothetical protein n=1 Tax=Legionella spiritensis TaxID=452 RepID=UPI000F6EA125|nr:hypothetical protein [Legionella spiritensis]VEG92287.1 Dot/Icm T4SS effector [Legionella spiritensis]